MKSLIPVFCSIFFLLIVCSTTSCNKEFIHATSACTASSPPAGSTHPKATAYQQLLDTYTKRGLPGISLLIRDANGIWVGSAGKADIDKDIAMSPCHISKAASITKMFVAVATMQLVEEGKLQLDEKITKWLPSSVTGNIENASATTLRQLLNHRTGIYDIIDDNTFYLGIVNHPTKRASLEELAQYVYGKPALFPVGDSAAYSNTNTLLVSMIVEKVTGKAYQQVVRERIITTLQLSNTHFITEGKLPANTAQGYYDLYNNGTIVNLSNYNTASGYGGMYSNVFDLQRFIEALLVEKTLVSPASLEQMLTFSPNIETGKRIGLGTMKDFLSSGESNFAYGHRGRDLAYTADLFYFPNQQTTIAMLLNYGTDANSALRPLFTEFREKLGELIVNQ
jgi:D-alanyl-D-alanine carboxypeptidase